MTFTGLSGCVSRRFSLRDLSSSRRSSCALLFRLTTLSWDWLWDKIFSTSSSSSELASTACGTHKGDVRKPFPFAKDITNDIPTKRLSRDLHAVRRRESGQHSSLYQNYFHLIGCRRFSSIWLVDCWLTAHATGMDAGLGTDCSDD